MSYLIYVIFGTLPSFIWLAYYLKHDVHPEPKKMILKVFLWGMLAAFPAVMIEMAANNLAWKLNFSALIVKAGYWFLGVAFVEEFLKYLVVRDKVLKSPEFNEPVDAMIYMIVAALGFAASENILIFLSQKLLFLPLEETLILLIFRFLSATFLHALSSALIGYFLALRFFQKKRGFPLLGLGLGISSFLHGLYNFSIMEISGGFKVAIPIFILAILAVCVATAFRELKKLTVN